MSGRPAVFLDRDGTLIEDTGYLDDPERVRLLPGAADAVRRINREGLLAIVVTNQSGIARGLLTEDQYRQVAERLEEELERAGARLDAQYYCPHLPELSGPCECRKPGLGLYRAAADRFDIDFSASWWVGDRERDVEPAAALGGRAILLGDADAPAESWIVRPNLFDAVEAIGGYLPRSMAFRIVVCVSGGGTNLEALLDALADNPAAEVVLVLSNRPDAGALDRARRRGVPVAVLDDHSDAAEWLRRLDAVQADLVVLAGYLTLVPADVVHRYHGRIINVHPALLPAFGGPGMYGRRVHEAVLASGAAESGATVHLVDEVYDRGRILAQAKVPVRPNDTPEQLAARVLEAEHRLLPAVVLAAARAGRPVPLPDYMESVL